MVIIPGGNPESQHKWGVKDTTSRYEMKRKDAEL